VSDIDRTSRFQEDDGAISVTKLPVLTVLQGESVGLTVQIEHDRTIIGRGANADLVLNDQVASRQHAEILSACESGIEFRLRDLESTNGTFLNGSQIESDQLLQDGDKIRIGKHLLKFALLDEVEVAALLKNRPQASEDPKPGPDSSDQILSFTPFHITLDVDLLYRGEAVVPLEPRAVRVLRYLAEHHERVVSKEELLEAVWPDVFTTDGVLKKAVSQVRRALCDDVKDARFIETYHRRGYRFVAPVQRRTRRRT
jgi:DNA-binding winged helix-turn-helix (wHTH) protein